MNLKKLHIDLNCDVGEGVNNEGELMPFISSCNIACGGHAGDGKTISKVIKLAKEYGVGVGAHPSFPDKANFGRVEMNISFEELKTSIHKQIDIIAWECKNQDVPLHHIKPHGALYNLCAKAENYAEIVIGLLEDKYPDIAVYAPFNSVMGDLAKGRIKVIFEAFADRNYEADGALVSRLNTNAIIKDKNALLNHVLRMVLSKEIKTISGDILKTEVNTICVHGDTPKAVELVKFLNTKLTEVGIQIHPLI